MAGKTKHTVAVVGLGLIGGSIALNLKKVCRVIGVDTNAETCDYALRNGFIDEVRPLESIKGVDAVLLCTPVEKLKETAAQVYGIVGESALITDVGSVKSVLGNASGRIVGGHPMAGSEKGGIRAAKEHLFENAYYCVIPYKRSSEEDVKSVEALARFLRATPVRLSPEEHDRQAAALSHAPHLAAYALCESALGERATPGSGFLDMTRIASSDPAFWTAVCALNRENVLSALDAYTKVLGDYRELLQNEDYDKLRAALENARQKRTALPAHPSLSLTVDVKDEVGSIGKVTDALRAAGIGIANLCVLHSREGVGGALQIDFYTVADTERAKAALAALPTV
ncbi:MAG: prephenate dehydrogenase/arogenate dehydrogenase family protein [Clostridiales bacterium]|nr:prephenate dehydrogenase/arogenate dehydrogenase family protein [Clostridiales bacterium]